VAAPLSSGDEDLAENHEINVTPFIDVMLVLLIIFMVAAPLATVDVKVDLPSSTAAPAPRPDHPVTVTLQADGALAVGEERVAPDHLGSALDAATRADKETRILLRADKTVDYAALMGVIDSLRAAGYLKLGLVGLDGGGQP